MYEIISLYKSFINHSFLYFSNIISMKYEPSTKLQFLKPFWTSQNPHVSKFRPMHASQKKSFCKSMKFEIFLYQSNFMGTRTSTFWQLSVPMKFHGYKELSKSTSFQTLQNQHPRTRFKFQPFGFLYQRLERPELVWHL